MTFTTDFYKLWLEKNPIEMYSIHTEGKPGVCEIFVRILNKQNL